MRNVLLPKISEKQMIFNDSATSNNELRNSFLLLPKYVLEYEIDARER